MCSLGLCGMAMLASDGNPSVARGSSRIRSKHTSWLTKELFVTGFPMHLYCTCSPAHLLHPDCSSWLLPRCHSAASTSPPWSGSCTEHTAHTAGKKWHPLDIAATRSAVCSVPKACVQQSTSSAAVAGALRMQNMQPQSCVDPGAKVESAAVVSSLNAAVPQNWQRHYAANGLCMHQMCAVKVYRDY